MTTSKTLKEEATNADVKFVFDGEKYTVSHPKLWPLEVVEAQEEGRVATAVKGILGVEQYKQFKSVPRTLEDLDKFVEALLAAAELELGKSED
jgi:hypothetical protein